MLLDPDFIDLIRDNLDLFFQSKEFGTANNKLALRNYIRTGSYNGAHEQLAPAYLTWVGMPKPPRQSRDIQSRIESLTLDDPSWSNIEALHQALGGDIPALHALS